jgi:hypothetical protein
MYKENPKTAGSGVICAIPQRGECPMRCPDCFFQAGRSYLEPLAENLPNMPAESEATNHVVRVNDGNDSNVDRELVVKATAHYRHKFYNTSIPKPFDEPFVLTVNPGKMTDASFHQLDPIPASLMFVRFRANTWNVNLTKEAVAWYTSKNVPVVLTFMAYFQHEGTIPAWHAANYIKRKRTINEYLAITTAAWRSVMREFEDNPLVHSCGKIEGEKGKSGCRYCGNCLREYYATLERMRGVDKS